MKKTTDNDAKLLKFIYDYRRREGKRPKLSDIADKFSLDTDKAGEYAQELQNSHLVDYKKFNNTENEPRVESDLSLSKIRHKVEGENRRAKISIAYRLAAYSAAKEADNQNTDSQLDTVITRLVKLNRLIKKQRNYTEVQG